MGTTGGWDLDDEEGAGLSAEEAEDAAELAGGACERVAILLVLGRLNICV
jgi:hypothetical protein